MVKRKQHRIPIPRKTEEVIRLAGRVVGKHKQDGDASVLRLLDMEAFIKAFTSADTESTESKEHRHKSETCVQNRNRVVGDRVTEIGTLRHGLACVLSALLAHYKGRERYLADWGFDVHASTSSGTAEEAKDGDNPGKAA